MEDLTDTGQGKDRLLIYPTEKEARVAVNEKIDPRPTDTRVQVEHDTEKGVLNVVDDPAEPKPPVTRGYQNKPTSKCWETPDWLFDEMNKIFRFTIDVCALPETAKCECYIAPPDVEIPADSWPKPCSIDGLTGGWHEMVCWMNPPYGRGIEKWIQVAIDETRPGNDCVVVCLIPCGMDANYWQDLVLPNAVDIRYIDGRVSFKIDGKDGNHASNTPNAIAVFSSYKLPKHIRTPSKRRAKEGVDG